ncbi:hypothetical protein ZWY2020_041952 [Hordeum vulgare]|nr:hypothetical protein ZWY2020_041952 [Hordeum vulgare]
MAIPHYAYLKMKMPGPKGIITVVGDYKKSLECSQDSSRLADALVIAEEKRQIDRLVAQATEGPAQARLQIHFAASNNAAEYGIAHSLRLPRRLASALICFGDSDLVVQQVYGEWDAGDANMASYRFLIQQLSGPFKGCKFHHVPRAENEAVDMLAKIGSTRQAIPAGVSVEKLHKPSPESASIFASDLRHKVAAPPAMPVDPTPVALTAPAPNATPTESTVQAPSAPPTTPASDPNPAPLVHPTPTTTIPALPGLELSQWVDVMEIDDEPAAAIAPETPSSSGAAEAPNS